MSPFIAEILGTFFLILFGGGVVANVVLTGTKGNNSGWIVITFGWGFAVFTGVAVAGPFSGAHLNPAVTIGLAVAGLFPWADVGTYIVAEMIGAMLGALGVFACYKTHFDATEDKGLKLAVFSTGPAIRNTANNFINEVIGTFALVFVILYLSGPTFSANGLENVQIGLGTLGAWPVAVLVTAIGLSLGGTTGYAINPARDLGPRIMHAILPIKDKGDSDWGYSWIPVVAPIVGCIIAALLWKALV
ncbi:MIP/aquaporin family protein [Pelagibaculum spongiae]|uniref:Aquaporin n=1 Tax=Pelagibaculum spongiae TaxID=2080658 RepID=A0A2V1GVE1_9GAMM|nr:MIP/aquaporin family protein [Pelagibaculum spongiae]PVZ63472.1 aquaporin [Pelagibaculum spongiae]